MNTMKNKREMVKCEGCGKTLVFDENLVKEVNGKVYCNKCVSER